MVSTTDGVFRYTSIVYPFFKKDAIDILPDKPWGEYIDFINSNGITKAKVTMPTLDGIQKCRSLKYLHIIPPQTVTTGYDFSPLYDMPEIVSLFCNNCSGFNWRRINEIDYSRIKGLKALSCEANRGAKNFERISGLKSLTVFSFGTKGKGIEDLFCSTELDTLKMQSCRNSSLDGIEKSRKMTCVYLYLNRNLQDISALRNNSDTITSLNIENCPKISDFSVLHELTKLENLTLWGSNTLEDLSFIKKMPNLKTLRLSMNVLDGDLSECKRLSFVCVDRIHRHYNVKEAELPQNRKEIFNGNESIEEWRRLE